MSTGTQEAIERQREMLYQDKSNEQLIMIALHNLIAATNANSSALMHELYDRYAQSSSDDTCVE